jgi:fructoselysine-6-P-deglycase FrlB-like protein
VASGAQTRAAIAAQPTWLRSVPTDRRSPAGRVVHTGRGTSYHTAHTRGDAVQALDFVVSPRPADVLVFLSHEGTTPPTLEAAGTFSGPRRFVTGTAVGPLAELCEEVVVCTPGVQKSRCHTASYTCAVAALAWPTAHVSAAHPVVDTLRFHQPTVDLAGVRGVAPDPIRRDGERWARAREAHE